MFSEDIVKSVWEKGIKVDGLEPSMYRKDACGALIMRDKYGLQNPFGWVIDHVFPQVLGGKDDMVNLRPLHYKNNISKSDDYPSYTSAIYFDGTDNIEREKNLTVNQKLRENLKMLYENA